MKRLDAKVESETETVGWAILQALHKGVDDGPQSWSDLSSDQEKRIKKAAIAAIEAVIDLSQYKAQGFSLPVESAVDILEPDGMSPMEIAIFQLRAAHRDIEISAYNAAKFRIEIAIAELRGLNGSVGVCVLTGGVCQYRTEPVQVQDGK